MGKTARQRTRIPSALKSEVGKCIALFRERQRQTGRPLPAGAAAPPGSTGETSVRDIVLLGRLVYAWEAIAGRDLRRFVYPVQLFRGRLTILCADSQWLQTLTYLKPQIQANLQRMFPDARITRIQGRLGTIPAVLQEAPTVTWPDWRGEPDANLPDIGNPELQAHIQACRKKLRARLQGLRQQGYHLCRSCQSNLVPRELDTCSICRFRAREQDLARARALLCETPWLRFEELQERIPDLDRLEFDALRSGLAGEAMTQVQLLGKALQEIFEGGTWMRMRYEMIRAVIFQTGLPPHLIDLDDPSGRFRLDPAWQTFLALAPEDAPC